MTVDIKYWPKDKSFTVIRHSIDGKIIYVYDGRSDEYMEWLRTGLKTILWSDRSTSWTDVDIKKDVGIIIIRTIFEHSKTIGLE